ncbi:unnamed protein product [Allacma fusca]|uniref:Uncharacterized protein n=1 Tax=Allacma fusca TaxID=39272 RepID=A0A8J2NW11_9HEXA|nr:unnamed protein product [Allacma fusca]
MRHRHQVRCSVRTTNKHKTPGVTCNSLLTKMVVLRQFWTPCYWYDDVREALNAIVFYTSMLSVIMITYTWYVLNGGESSQFYMPYFETDQATSLPWVGSFVIIFMLLLFASSILVRHGVQVENRGMMLPWLILIGMILAYQLYVSFWLLYSYYIYLETVLVVLIDWLWMSYNAYVWLAVYSMYQQIQMKQNPSFDYIY